MAFENVFDSSLVDYSKEYEKNDVDYAIIDECADKALTKYINYYNITEELRDGLNTLEDGIYAAVANARKGLSFNSYLRDDFGIFLESIIKQISPEKLKAIGLDPKWWIDSLDFEYTNSQRDDFPDSLKKKEAQQNAIIDKIVDAAKKKWNKEYLKKIIIEEIDEMFKNIHE